jgi:uncharacterized protein
MSLYEEIIPPCLKFLDNMDGWLAAGVEHAKKKSFEPSVLLHSRLAPDQFPLIRQISAGCDQAKAAAARVAGQEPPKHPDTEQTLEDILGRIKITREYLKSLSPKDFEGAETRMVPLAFAPGAFMVATDYVRQLAMPNFYFHAALAYEILRHNGVDLGKVHFIGHLTIAKT